MNVIVDLCIVPLGVGVSLSPYVAACERTLRDSGLNIRLHAYGTNIEGEWDAVFTAVKRCHEAVHDMGDHHFVLGRVRALEADANHDGLPPKPLIFYRGTIGGFAAEG